MKSNKFLLDLSILHNNSNDYHYYFRFGISESISSAFRITSPGTFKNCSAERSVNAQAALVGASKSDWLPQVFLKGSVGYAAKDLKDLTHHKSMTYEIAPALSWTLFKGTQLVNATKLAKAQLDEAINQFNQTVLTAVQETDNAMNAYRNSIKQIVALREVRNQGQETLTLSLELYKQGLTPFQNVLDAQRSLLSYENQLVQARGYSLLQLIAMYQALGGGWSGNLNN